MTMWGSAVVFAGLGLFLAGHQGSDLVCGGFAVLLDSVVAVNQVAGLVGRQKRGGFLEVFRKPFDGIQFVLVFGHITFPTL